MLTRSAIMASIASSGMGVRRLPSAQSDAALERLDGLGSGSSGPATRQSPSSICGRVGRGRSTLRPRTSRFDVRHRRRGERVRRTCCSCAGETSVANVRLLPIWLVVLVGRVLVLSLTPNGDGESRLTGQGNPWESDAVPSSDRSSFVPAGRWRWRGTPLCRQGQGGFR